MSFDGVEVFAVVAAATNRVIGRDNQLPWRISSDLKHFKRLTMGCPIVMGRRTFASIGKPLPGRANIVVTRDGGFSVDGVVVAASLEAALAQGARIVREMGAAGIALVGGGDVYAQALRFTDRVELTEVKLAPDPAGAVLFPELATSEWVEVARVPGERTEKDEADFDFVTLKRR
ncbi:dihydrofolate reductase [Pinisolibacter sp.]|uniref:dihydrofolate reductase n=1 Tax=Pinisolibacter sp. TaxID=2172024 RepID=UPI002FDDC407